MKLHPYLQGAVSQAGAGTPTSIIAASMKKNTAAHPSFTPSLQGTVGKGQIGAFTAQLARLELHGVDGQTITLERTVGRAEYLHVLSNNVLYAVSLWDVLAQHAG